MAGGSRGAHMLGWHAFGLLVGVVSGFGLVAGDLPAAPSASVMTSSITASIVPIVPIVPTASPATDTLTSTPTGTPVPTCGPNSNYTVSASVGDIVPGTTLVPGSQCEDCIVVLSLPFAYSIYDTSHTTVFASANGNLQFTSNYPTGANVCIPAFGFPRVIFAHWDDLSTSGTGRGIYTSISGSAPNRIFNIEWRATYAGTGGLVNFGVRLYEGQRKFDVIYNHVDQGGSGATVGVQHSPVTLYTQYECDTTGSLQPGLLLTFTQPACGTSTTTPSPTATPTIPSTPTTTRTPTVTPVCTPTLRMALMIDFQYIPQTITITAGTTVRWLNEGPSQHTTTSDTGVWDSGFLNPGQVFNFTFNAPGLYPYHCTLHPGMTGTITVTSCAPTVTATTTPSMTAIVTTVTATTTATSAGISTPTPLPTYTIVPPSSTSTVTAAAGNTQTPTATATGVATSTPCSTSFTDVAPGDYFYAAVRYLYCRGVISGYADNTFRPYNDATRGQLSKIVVLARGWPGECPQNGHFTDVPPDSTFYCFIETAYAHGLITGYSDGTFRPGNNVTRGQLSKIVVLAMGWPQVCPPPGHFSDVPPNSTFFCFIETAYGYGLITGYADGTFRPGNNATRGQISKIIYRAITTP